MVVYRFAMNVIQALFYESYSLFIIYFYLLTLKSNSSNKNQYGEDSLTAGYRRALQGKSYGYTPEWNWETGEYSIMGNPIVESILSDSEILNAQNIGISTHAEDIDLNGRGFGGEEFTKRVYKKRAIKTIFKTNYRWVSYGGR